MADEERGWENFLSGFKLNCCREVVRYNIKKLI